MRAKSGSLPSSPVSIEMPTSWPSHISSSCAICRIANASPITPSPRSDVLVGVELDLLEAAHARDDVDLAVRSAAGITGVLRRVTPLARARLRAADRARDRV